MRDQPNCSHVRFVEMRSDFDSWPYWQCADCGFQLVPKRVCDDLEQEIRWRNEADAGTARLSAKDLRELEWVVREPPNDDICAVCGKTFVSPPRGTHKPDCWLAAAIKEAQGE